MKTYNQIEEELEQRYLDFGGNRCPFCESDNISAGHFEADNMMAWRNIECLQCGKDWTETLAINGASFKIEDIEELLKLQTK